MSTLLRRNRVARRGSAAESRDAAAGARVGALFDEFAPMVLAVCRYNLRDRQAAEDAAQETFLSAHRSLLGGTQPRDPAAWLATIARNECRRTRTKARAAPLDEDTTGTLGDPADIVADRADFSDVATAIAELPARQREALVLREFCGLSYEQTAAAMSVSGAAVDSLLSRARRRLVEQLGEIPRAAQGTLVVPASLREELSRLIPGLEAAATGAGAGAAGGGAMLASLGSAPAAAKVAATCAAAVAVAVPVQATVRGDDEPRANEVPRGVAASANEADGASPPAAVLRAVPSVSRPAGTNTGDESGTTSRGAGSGPSGSGSSSSGPGPGSPESASDSSGPGSASDGSGSVLGGSGSSGSGSESSGSGSSGSGSSGSGSSGSGSESSGSESSGSGSSGSGSGSSGSGSSGSGSDSSGSGSSGSGSDSSGSGSSGSGSSGSGSDSSGSGSSGSGSGSSGDD